MIYVDSCVPMYLVGAHHSLKNRTVELIPSLLHSKEDLVTSAEAFQEIIHRYRALLDRKGLEAAYAALEEMVGLTADVRKSDTGRACDVSAGDPRLSSRDCLHAAIMQRLGCSRIWTYDNAFDALPKVVRIY